jgi:site-specific DNA-cytosine methylase
MENVRGHLSMGGDVLADLAEIGYDAEWRVIPAAGVGALHKRDRVSLWPTPTAVVRPMEGNVRLYRAKIAAGEMTETEANAMLGKSVWAAQGKVPALWPTPTTQEVEHPQAELTTTGRRKSKNGKTSHSLGLADAVQMWPTPTASSWGNTGSREMLDKHIASGNITEQDKRAMTAGNGGKLNPTWVEWLMGFPTGWTDLED